MSVGEEGLTEFYGSGFFPFQHLIIKMFQTHKMLEEFYISALEPMTWQLQWGFTYSSGGLYICKYTTIGANYIGYGKPLVC